MNNEYQEAYKRYVNARMSKYAKDVLGANPQMHTLHPSFLMLMDWEERRLNLLFWKNIMESENFLKDIKESIEELEDE